MNTRFTSRVRSSIYWIATALVAVNLGVGAVIDIARIPYIRKMGMHLGYPDYLFINLAVWEVLGMVALLIPGFPRLKEWAYAGTFFLFTGAIFSRMAVGDEVSDVTLPMVLTALTVTSWALRPPSRKL